MTTRKLIGKLHLWLGLASGLIVFILATTFVVVNFLVDIIYTYLDPRIRFR